VVRYLRFILCLLLIAGAGGVTFAQTKDTIKVGTATALLKDSVHNYVMASATVSVYTVTDNKLINYQLVNNFGRFQFKQLPVGVKLRVVSTFVGYAAGTKDFTISPKTKTIDLGMITMQRLDNTLKEVKITAAPPPMQMHGDTLEFNADAFKLDTNAVVEDLLRRLTGVTIWADGMITVNGKKINQLLVENKPFFGGNNKIALQNIPKNAVKKVQVYDVVDKSQPVTEQPTTNMNIILKDDKKDGYFGKAGGGYGTDKRYAADAMISYFSPKDQLSLVGALNNVNKTAYNVSTLMGFNSFKGEGINNPYNSDFTRQGLNVFKAIGLTYAHDYAQPSAVRMGTMMKSRFTADYFMSDAAADILSKSNTLTTLSPNEQVQRAENNTTRNTNFSQQARADYTKVFKYSDLDASVYYKDNGTTGLSTLNRTSFNTLTGAQSQSTDQRDNTGNTHNTGGEIKFNTQTYYPKNTIKSKGIDMRLDYTFDLNNANNDNKRLTQLTASDASLNKYFNRKYATNNSTIDQAFKLTFPIREHRLNFVSATIDNSLAIYDRREHNDVFDLPAAATGYVPNANLTNVTHYRTIDERPGISFSKSFSKSLDNRYSKSLSISVTAREQLFKQDNESQKAFQNLSRSYFYFIPSSSITYRNNQVGEFSKSYSLNYNTSVIYPSIYQLAPLNDDADVYTINFSNPALRPTYSHDLSFSYSYYSTGAKNPLTSNLTVTAGIDKNPITDSMFIDGIGRNMHYYVNGTSSKHASLNGYAFKAFKFNDNQLQFNSFINGSYREYPSSVNGVTYSTRSSYGSVSTSLNYNYKGLATVEVSEGFSASKTTQGKLSNNYFYTWSTGAAAAFALPKSIFFNTRLNFNNTKSSYANNIYYTIWNADIGYRFLKGANAEVKLSALDILHQNKSIINYVTSNSVTTGTVNVLQQYFMLTLAYYPRKFGLSKK
jgi:hypothetical protein